MQVYTDLTHLIERLHRRFLDVIRAELARLGIEEVNAVQALLLTNIGREELTVGELVQRGYYLGSNASYNIKRLVTVGYLEQERSPHDRRSVRIRLSQKGLDLCDRIKEMEEGIAASLIDREGEDDLGKAADALRAIERCWSDHIQYGGR